MSLVALDGTPLVAIGGTMGDGTLFIPGNSNTTQDAANEACIMIGQLRWADGASHTVDTTGSSSLGWRAGARTFANAGTTFVVGLATVDTTNGPPGRAVNVANVITFDVSRSYTSAAATTANAWNESVPTSGTKTIAHGELIAFCTQMTARGGADSVITTTSNTTLTSTPLMTSYVGGTYTAVNAVPNVVVTASDGTLGFFFGGNVFSVASTTQTWNNTSGTKEYGNFFQIPVPAKVYGLIAACSVGGDLDGVLYSDPLGTPVSEKSRSIDLNTVSAVGAGQSKINALLFSSPYQTTASQPLAGIIKPTSATNVDAPYSTLNAAAHMGAYPLGTNCYAVNRNSGAFAAQNSSKDRFAIGLLVGAFDAGGSTGRAIQINNPSLVS